MLLNDPNPLRIGDLGMAGAVHNVECVDRRTSLGLNSRKRHQNIFEIEAAKYIVKQSDAVRCLKLNERVSQMRFVVDRDASRKFNSHSGAAAQAPRFFNGWEQVEALVLESVSQCLSY